MPIDPQEQRKIIGCFATGITVVTTRYGESLGGMTANAVTSLSLTPPLILVAIDRKGQMYSQVEQGKCFAVNILTESQEPLSRRFASAGPKDFSDIPWENGSSGAPILKESLAYVDCRLVEILSGGDHGIFIGEILAGGIHQENAQPLLYYRGQYRKLA